MNDEFQQRYKANSVPSYLTQEMSGERSMTISRIDLTVQELIFYRQETHCATQRIFLARELLYSTLTLDFEGENHEHDKKIFAFDGASAGFTAR